MMTDTIAAPLVAPDMRVLPEWIDYNGHMNVAYYVLAFDKAVDHFLTGVGVGEDYNASGAGTTFTLQSNVRYLREVTEGDPLRITVQLLDYDVKRAHYFMHMYHADEGFLSATAEQINMHIAFPERRSAPYPQETLDQLDAMMASHRKLDTPDGVGAPIGIRR